jgi:hypothetical protein
MMSSIVWKIDDIINLRTGQNALSQPNRQFTDDTDVSNNNYIFAEGYMQNYGNN